MLENDGLMASIFPLQPLNNVLLTVYGDGSQARSFCYVSEPVEGLIRLVERDWLGPVNLRNPTENIILELAQIILKMVNPNAEILNQPLPQDDPRRRRPDITLAEACLGWAPTIELHEDLRLLVDDFRERLGTPAFLTTPLKGGFRWSFLARIMRLRTDRIVYSFPEACELGDCRCKYV